MSSSPKYLLPIYYVRKKTKKSFNEKNLIIILLLTSVFSLIFILKNLPAHVSFGTNDDLDNSDNVNVRNIFFPKLNLTRDQFIHNEAMHHHVVPKISNKSAEQVQQNSNGNSAHKAKKTKETSANDLRRKKIKQVQLFGIRLFF